MRKMQPLAVQGSTQDNLHAKRNNNNMRICTSNSAMLAP